MLRNFHLVTLLGLLLLLGCDTQNPPEVIDGPQSLTIFFINDPHSQLDNFAKIKPIVDAAREQGNTLLVAGGDIFSGSPYVDQYAEKGFPIIDVMNETGFDAAVIGNHEFDYGLEILQNRIEQSQFAWVCANVNAESSPLTQPDAYRTLTVGDVRVTFLGLVETNGQEGAVIPATHPWKVAEVSFQPYEEVVGNYADLKAQEDADVFIALTHLGIWADQYLANNWPYFDLIIGGHSNHESLEIVNGIPTLMAGSYLSHLGRIDLKIENGEVSITHSELIDLNQQTEEDAALAQLIAGYTENPDFAAVIGTAASHHDRTELGCFYTEALATYMGVDIAFQNGGGIRTDLAAGDITPFEIYSIDPFNNGSVVFTKTVREIKDFFIQTGQGLHVYGITLERVGNDLVIRNQNGEVLDDNVSLTLGINDYIPATNPGYFDIGQADIRPLTTAETLVDYLKTVNSTVNHEGCNHYFRY